MVSRVTKLGSVGLMGVWDLWGSYRENRVCVCWYTGRGFFRNLIRSLAGNENEWEPLWTKRPKAHNAGNESFRVCVRVDSFIIMHLRLSAGESNILLWCLYSNYYLFEFYNYTREARLRFIIPMKLYNQILENVFTISDFFLYTRRAYYSAPYISFPHEN